VRQGDCSFSEFHVKWLGDDSDSWVPECDIDPELVAAYRAKRRDQPLPSSSPCMAGAAAAAATVAGSSTLSSSATKSSSSGIFSAGRGKAFKSARSNVQVREHVSFCSQLTPVALECPSQVNDGFLSPVVNTSLLAAMTSANAMSSIGTSALAASSLFCSPAAVADAQADLNGGESSSSSQSQLQLGANSVTSTQQPSTHATPPASQKSSLSVEFPPSFPYRLSQHEPCAPAPQHRAHDVMDIGDYCVGMLPSLCAGSVVEPPRRFPPPLVSSTVASASSCIPQAPFSKHEQAVLPAVDPVAEAASMDGVLGCDGSARKRRRVAASRNLGGCINCHIVVGMHSHHRVLRSNHC
jgi:hypothetical protein